MLPVNRIVGIDITVYYSVNTKQQHSGCVLNAMIFCRHFLKSIFSQNVDSKNK